MTFTAQIVKSPHPAVGIFPEGSATVGKWIVEHWRWFIFPIVIIIMLLDILSFENLKYVIIALVIIIPLTGFLLIILWRRSNSYEIKGNLEITTDRITIQSSDLSLVASMNQVSDLVFCQNSYAGSDYRSGIERNRDFQQYNNWINFTYSGFKYEFEFAINGQQKAQQLSTLLDSLRQSGVAFKYVEL